MTIFDVNNISVVIFKKEKPHEFKYFPEKEETDTLFGIIPWEKYTVPERWSKNEKTGSWDRYYTRKEIENANYLIIRDNVLLYRASVEIYVGSEKLQKLFGSNEEALDYIEELKKKSNVKFEVL